MQSLHHQAKRKNKMFPANINTAKILDLLLICSRNATAIYLFINLFTLKGMHIWSAPFSKLLSVHIRICYSKAIFLEIHVFKLLCFSVQFHLAFFCDYITKTSELGKNLFLNGNRQLTLQSSLDNFRGLFGRTLSKPVFTKKYHDFIGMYQFSRKETN